MRRLAIALLSVSSVAACAYEPTIFTSKDSYSFSTIYNPGDARPIDYVHTVEFTFKRQLELNGELAVSVDRSEYAEGEKNRPEIKVSFRPEDESLRRMPAISWRLTEAVIPNWILLSREYGDEFIGKFLDEHTVAEILGSEKSSFVLEARLFVRSFEASFACDGVSFYSNDFKIDVSKSNNSVTAHDDFVGGGGC